jgi:hypothetical protein
MGRSMLRPYNEREVGLADQVVAAEAEADSRTRW